MCMRVSVIQMYVVLQILKLLNWEMFFWAGSRTASMYRADSCQEEARSA